MPRASHRRPRGQQGSSRQAVTRPNAIRGAPQRTTCRNRPALPGRAPAASRIGRQVEPYADEESGRTKRTGGRRHLRRTSPRRQLTPGFTRAEVQVRGAGERGEIRRPLSNYRMRPGASAGVSPTITECSGSRPKFSRRRRRRPRRPPAKSPAGTSARERPPQGARRNRRPRLHPRLPDSAAGAEARPARRCPKWRSPPH